MADLLPPPADPDRMQRLRVGATGLAAVMLTILVATAVASGVRSNADNVAVAANVASDNASGPTEPLAQLGAAPAPEKTGNASAPAAR